MAKGTTLGKLNLHLCFSMLMNNKPHHPQLTHTTTSPPPTTTTTTTTTTFIKTYNSLYEDTTTTTTTTTDTDMAEGEAVPEDGPTTPDLAAAYASRRFFISSPGRSNSIVDSLSLSTLSSPDEDDDGEEVVEGGVAVQTYSPDPYADFRRSMEEMVAAREVARVEEAWEYLQELLLTYLALNPESTHKYIVGAFSDLVFSLLSPHNTNNHNHIINHHHNNNASCSSSSSCGGGEIIMSE